MSNELQNDIDHLPYINSNAAQNLNDELDDELTTVLVNESNNNYSNVSNDSLNYLDDKIDEEIDTDLENELINELEKELNEESDSQNVICNLCLDEYKFDENDYSTFPYKLCLNDHFFCGKCIEHYIKSTATDFCHLITYYPGDMYAIVKSYPLLNNIVHFYHINCPSCRTKIKINSYLKLDRSRIYEQIVKGNINPKSSIGKEISIFKNTCSQLENKIAEFTSINETLNKSVKELADIEESKKGNILKLQKKYHLLTKLLKKRNNEFTELNLNLQDHKQKLKDEAFNEVKDEIDRKKIEMNIILEEYRIEIKDKFKKIYDTEKHIFEDTIINYQKEIKDWESKLNELDTKMKLELTKFNSRLQEEKEELVWKFIKNNNILNKFIEMVKNENIREIEEEKNNRINIINQIISRERQVLIDNLYKDIEIKRRNLTN